MLREPYWIFLDVLGTPGPGDADRILGALLLSGERTAGRLVLHPVRGLPEEGWRSLLMRINDAEEIAPAIICCDGDPIVTKAIRAIYPDTPIQISLTHRLRTLGEHLTPRGRGPCLTEARRIFQAPDRGAAVLRFRTCRDRWLNQGEWGVRMLERDLAWCLTFYRFPPPARRTLRSLRLLRLAARAAQGTAQAPSPPQPPTPEGNRSEEPVPSAREDDRFIVHVDDLINDPTFVQWLRQYGRDRLRLVQAATAVASAIGLAARFVARGH